MALKLTLVSFMSSAFVLSVADAGGFLAQGQTSESEGSIGEVRAEVEDVQDETSPDEWADAHGEVEVGEVVNASSADLAEAGDDSQADDFASSALDEDGEVDDTSDAHAASAGQCDTALLRKLQKKVGHHVWHDCVDPNPEVCHSVDSAIKAYLRKGGKPAAKRSLCRHQGTFKNALENNYDKCNILITKARHEGLYLPSSMESFKRMCR